MRKYTQEELVEILALHKRWLNNEEGGVAANLSYANLRGADLSGANLRGANLSGANLSGANLRDAIGNSFQVKTIAVSKYTIVYTEDILAIGCQSHTIEQWRIFTDEQIEAMDTKALDWWNIWKPIIFNIIELAPAEPTYAAN